MVDRLSSQLWRGNSGPRRQWHDDHIDLPLAHGRTPSAQLADRTIRSVRHANWSWRAQDTTTRMSTSFPSDDLLGDKGICLPKPATLLPAKRGAICSYSSMSIASSADWSKITPRSGLQRNIKKSVSALRRDLIDEGGCSTVAVNMRTSNRRAGWARDIATVAESPHADFRASAVSIRACRLWRRRYRRPCHRQDIPLWWAKGAKAYHQYHKHHMPPVHHLDSVVANAQIFAEKWGEPTMQHWLRAFRLMGLIEPDGAGGWIKLREPGERDLALTRQQEHQPYASSARARTARGQASRARRAAPRLPK